MSVWYSWTVSELFHMKLLQLQTIIGCPSITWNYHRHRRHHRKPVDSILCLFSIVFIYQLSFFRLFCLGTQTKDLFDLKKNQQSNKTRDKISSLQCHKCLQSIPLRPQIIIVFSSHTSNYHRQKSKSFKLTFHILQSVFTHPARYFRGQHMETVRLSLSSSWCVSSVMLKLLNVKAG